MVKKGKKDQLVNYRVKGRVMEVDGLFETIALVVGVNGGLFNSGLGGEKQQVVEITRRAAGSVAPSMTMGG
jgi:LytS/YehU family sensor histidine kinase